MFGEFVEKYGERIKDRKHISRLRRKGKVKREYLIPYKDSPLLILLADLCLEFSPSSSGLSREPLRSREADPD